MPKQNEWIFDAIRELSDRSFDAGFPDLAEKLDDVLDTYLAEHQLSKPKRQHLAGHGVNRHRMKKRVKVKARIKTRKEMRQSIGAGPENFGPGHRPEASEPMLLTPDVRVA